MVSPASKSVFAGLGGVVAAVASSLCCAGPLIAVALGFSGAGLAATFDPLRPYLVGGTVLFLSLGFATAYREDRKACEPGALCASPEARRRMKLWLWSGTAIAIPFATFQWWSPLIFS